MPRKCLVLATLLALFPAWLSAGEKRSSNKDQDFFEGLAKRISGVSSTDETASSSGKVWFEDQPTLIEPASYRLDDESTGDEQLESGDDSCCCDDCGVRYVCGNCCGPDICRFDYPADCSCCTTDQYCEHCCSDVFHGHCRQTGECGEWACDGCYCDVKAFDPYPLIDPVNYYHSSIVRFGWWGVETDGELVKTGEYQDLNSSPFYDFDSLNSNGEETFNVFANGTDQEANQAGLQFYNQAGDKVSVQYQRFLRRLDHDPFNNFTPEADRINTTDTPVLVEDLNVGDDYAIRVEQLKASASTRLSENWKFRLDLWGMRKFGERAAEGMAHCFNVAAPNGGNYCHVTTQRQQIDWLTMEITPRLQADFGAVQVEYSRPMRSFSQNDQNVLRRYTNPFGNTELFPSPGSNAANPDINNYAFVPDNYTEIDQVKIGAELSENTNFYGFGYYGRTRNKYRETERKFGGYDMRITNHSVDGLTLTGYAKLYDQEGDRPGTLLGTETANLTPAEAQEHIRNPVEYYRNTAGIKGRWRPDRFSAYFDNLLFTGGYEWDQLERNNAVYESVFQFVQPDTVTHTVHAGLQSHLTQSVDSFVRYKVLFVDAPLYGFRETNGALNSSQPEQQHIIEVGGTWAPAPNFMAMATAQFDLRRHYADISTVPDNVIDFDEQNYPITATLWYAPTPRLSLTGSAAFLYSWIDQNIILGDDYVEDPMMPNPLLNPVTTRWNYTGQTTVISFSGNYAWTDYVNFIGGYEYVRGYNGIGNGSVDALWPDLATYSRVIVETNRLTAGVDYRPYDRMNLYFRYVHFGYSDGTQNFNTGTANMFLGGMAYIY